MKSDNARFYNDGSDAIRCNPATDRYDLIGSDGKVVFSDVRFDVVVTQHEDDFFHRLLFTRSELNDLQAANEALRKAEAARIEKEEATLKATEEAKVLEFAGVVVAESVVEAAV